MSKLTTVGKDMLIYFYLVMAIQTLSALCREKVLSELPNRSMVENSSSCPGIQYN